MIRPSHVQLFAAMALFPAAACFAIDTTIVVRGLGDEPAKSSLYRDANGDGIITDCDIVLQLNDRIGGGDSADYDGDGEVTTADTIAVVAAVIKSSFGDVTGDYQIDQADLDAIVQALYGAAASFDKDPNGDGVIDVQDVLYIIEKMQENSQFGVWHETMSVAAGLLIHARASGLGPLYSDQTATPHHMIGVTESWPLAPKHSTEDSLEVWPANHMKNESLAWLSKSQPSDPLLPRHDQERTKQWPPSHNVTFSRGWDRPPAGPNHAVNSSAETPYHDGFYSEHWKNTPNHERSFSVTWDPDGPGTQFDHLIGRSQAWPTDHSGAESIKMPVVVPTEHRAAFSQSWCPSPATGENCWTQPTIKHGLTRSSSWVPEHEYNISLTWQPAPPREVFTWPPNHNGQVSLAWPQHMMPGQWPANHVVSVSQSPEMPPLAPGPANWPGWPANHDWLTTIRQVTEIPANIAPVLPLIPVP